MDAKATRTECREAQCRGAESRDRVQVAVILVGYFVRTGDYVAGAYGSRSRGGAGGLVLLLRLLLRLLLLS